MLQTRDVQPIDRSRTHHERPHPAVNHDQIRDCTRLVGKLVPLVIEIMLDHPETLSGDACYPVVA